MADREIHEMAIDRETFQSASEDELTELSVPDKVLAFLGINDEHAFKASEIASRTGLEDGAVSTALSRLKDRGLVEHKGTYWAVTDDEERLARHTGYERATAMLNERLGEEERDAWLEHAPDEDHPSVDPEGDQ
jgi:DNA-binding transcriptional ArsR family regulator